MSPSTKRKNTTVRKQSTKRKTATARNQSTKRKNATVRNQSTKRKNATVRNQSTKRKNATAGNQSTKRKNATAGNQSTKRKNSTVRKQSTKRKKESKKLYHYTSEEGLKGILKSMRIYPSTNTATDAILGEGVYLTHLPPIESSAKIISNNWNLGRDINNYFVQQHIDKIVFCIEFDEEDLPGLRKLPGSRDVVMYPGSIDLNSVPHVVKDTTFFQAMHELMKEELSSCNML
ncbi:hypothetical protein L9F63_013571 [Diploptera punctata]|uniref:Tox-ART-HYD1 domain-containing protein n=1 Tax=Diploptera punctata TaxID=6984 RepID=A0AAD8A9S1_DIPPU|nr:hypothetical protein L9F63_013571 [Diploptera punctata]